ncbi:MAG: ABC transporter permease [Lachnospiraceae bacterium]
MKTPLVRIVKSGDRSKQSIVLIYATSIILALLICAVILFALTKSNPADIYMTMIYGAFGSNRKIWVTIRETMLLLGVALALTPVFKMKFWNIGGEGQILAGGIATAAVMIYLGDKLPAPLLIAVMVLASLAAGLIWGIFPAICKAKWKTNETLFTLMLNYIALQLTSFFTIVWERVEGSGSIGIINRGTKAGWLPTDFLSGIFGPYNFAVNVIIVLILSIAITVYVKYTKQGYELSVVGESENTARYVGINVKKVIIRTMAISGALCGFMGFLIVSGSSHTITTSTADNRGFTAIIVTWLARFNPVFMFLISMLLILMDQGASQVASDYNLNESAADVLTGIILFFILASDFFTNYRLVFRHKVKEV